MHCDIIAQGIINAFKTTKLSIPIIVRLEGTNVEQGKKLLLESQLPLQAATDLTDAAQKVVFAAQASLSDLPSYTTSTHVSPRR
jgi:succinyl-CoA synthetase beta subunit